MARSSAAQPLKQGGLLTTWKFLSKEYRKLEKQVFTHHCTTQCFNSLASQARNGKDLEYCYENGRLPKNGIKQLREPMKMAVEWMKATFKKVRHMKGIRQVHYFSHIVQIVIILNRAAAVGEVLLQ